MSADAMDRATTTPRIVGQARTVLASAVNHSTDGEDVHVARRLDQAAILLEGVVDADIWFRVRAAKLMHCNGREHSARQELRDVMGLLDAELTLTEDDNEH